jgi:hypothetical protein
MGSGRRPARRLTSRGKFRPRPTTQWAGDALAGLVGCIVVRPRSPVLTRAIVVSRPKVRCFDRSPLPRLVRQTER